MFLKGQAKYVPCALLHTPKYQSLAHGKNLQAQEIALTQLSLTLVSRVCQLCCNDIHRLIKSASITPRWEKGGTRPKCCISNCHATSFATSKIATSEQISQIFPCSNIPCPTPLCKRHYHSVYDTIQSKQTHCFTCNSSLCNFCVRVCPNPKLVQQVLGERTGFEETIPTSARVCAPCYKAHLLIIKEGPKSIDQDLIQLITDLKRGIPSSDTIKIKDDIVNKALHTLVIYVGEKLLHEESLLLPAVHQTFSSIVSDIACTVNVTK